MTNIVYNKNGIPFDIDAIVTDLNGKADVDLTNVNNTGTSKVAGWTMPSDKYIDLTLGASGSTYTAPANGFYYINTTSPNGNFAYFVLINNTKDFTVQNQVYTSNGSIVLLLPVTKGDEIGTEYSNITSPTFRFYYAVGSESEAQ